MRRKYIWEAEDWPGFTRDADQLLRRLGAARQAQGQFTGLMITLGFGDRRQAELNARIEEAVETADIEGEAVSRAAVRSSIARRLNIDAGAVSAIDAKIEGLVDMTLDAAIEYAAPLTIKRLHRWHAGLFPMAPGGPQSSFVVGRWRKDSAGPMQVVSGRLDKPTVHFQAPPAARVPAEMEAFLRWFESPENDDGLLRSATAHLWFVTIHPYADGNGRIGRAIADMALARDEQSSQRYYSMSRQINAEKHAYYDAFERAQQGNLDITNWLVWFLESYARAIKAAHVEAGAALNAQAFWRSHEDVALSDRQRRAINRLMHSFDGKLTVKKWARVTKTSDDTAQRDITDLVDKRVLVKNYGGSKKTSYSLVGYEFGYQPAARS